MLTESQFLFGFFLPSAAFMPKNIDKRIDFVELLKDFSTAYLLANRIVNDADIEQWLCFGSSQCSERS